MKKKSKREKSHIKSQANNISIWANEGRKKVSGIKNNFFYMNTKLLAKPKDEKDAKSETTTGVLPPNDLSPSNGKSTQKVKNKKKKNKMSIFRKYKKINNNAKGSEISNGSGMSKGSKVSDISRSKTKSKKNQKSKSKIRSKLKQKLFKKSNENKVTKEKKVNSNHSQKVKSSELKIATLKDLKKLKLKDIQELKSKNLKKYKQDLKKTISRLSVFSKITKTKSKSSVLSNVSKLTVTSTSSNVKLKDSTTVEEKPKIIHDVKPSNNNKIPTNKSDQNTKDILNAIPLTNRISSLDDAANLIIKPDKINDPNWKSRPGFESGNYKI